MPTAASTRWCPTPEQLMILEELYRGGIRTPNSIQIQQITTHLSLYGKIEGKNVFYWFQNHKARDRQKLRRKLLRQQQQLQLPHHNQTPPYDSPSPPPPPSAAAALQHFPLYNQAHLLPQGRESSNQVMMSGNGWTTMDSSLGLEMEMPHTMCISHDWLMTMKMNENDAGPCCDKPPKTLQLFPITTNALKDECITSHHHFSPAPPPPPPPPPPRNHLNPRPA